MLYFYGQSYLDGNLKSGLAAVIRQPQRVNLEQSVKFSLKDLGKHEGLGVSRIAEARRQLQLGNWCKSLSAFENEYSTFTFAFLKAFGVGPKHLGRALDSIWLVSNKKGKTRLQASIESISANKLLVKELLAAGFVTNSTPEVVQSDVWQLIRNMLLNQMPDSPDLPPEAVPARIALLVRVLQETGVWQIEGTPQTTESLSEAVGLSSQRMLERWALDHPNDVALATDLLRALDGHSLAGMSPQIPSR